MMKAKQMSRTLKPAFPILTAFTKTDKYDFYPFHRDIEDRRKKGPGPTHSERAHSNRRPLSSPPLHKIRTHTPWAVWISGLGVAPQSKRLTVWSQSGHLPGLPVLVGACAKGTWTFFFSHIKVSLLHFPSPFPFLLK